MTGLAVRQTRPKIGLSARLPSRYPRAAGSLAPLLGGRVRWVPLTGDESVSELRLQGLAGLVLAASEYDDRNTPLPMTDPNALRDQEECDHFVERVFAHGRLVDLLAADWRISDLVEFHTNHKLQLFSHHPARTRELGRLVAHAREQPGTAELGEAYRRSFADIMASTPTTGRRTDALLHAAGYLPSATPETIELRARIEAFRLGEQPFEWPLRLLTQLVFGHGVGYLIRQTFFEPSPNQTDL